MLQAFDVVEKSYFETIDDALAEKANLSSYHLQHNEVTLEIGERKFTGSFHSNPDMDISVSSFLATRKRCSNWAHLLIFIR